MAGRKNSNVTHRAHAPAWAVTFLLTLAATGNVASSCRAADVSRQTAYTHRAEFPEFAAAWEDAREDALDKLEGVLWKEGAKGNSRAIELVLKAYRPQFREGNNSVQVQVNNYMSPEDEQRESDALMAQVREITGRMDEHKMIEQGDDSTAEE